MNHFTCPYLQSEVELSAERLTHITTQHPELADNLPDWIERTLLDPDQVRKDGRFAGTHLFSRWFDDLLRGKVLVVAVVTDAPASDETSSVRHWIVTVYPTRKITQGDIQWQRP